MRGEREREERREREREREKREVYFSAFLHFYDRRCEYLSLSLFSYEAKCMKTQSVIQFVW